MFIEIRLPVDITGAYHSRVNFFLLKPVRGYIGFLGGSYQCGKTESGNKLIAIARCDAFEKNLGRASFEGRDLILQLTKCCQ
jgi:hypothetical protein